MTPIRGATILVLTVGMLVGCEEAPPDPVERVRTIKPYYVNDLAGGDVRRTGIGQNVLRICG